MADCSFFGIPFAGATLPVRHYQRDMQSTEKDRAGLPGGSAGAGGAHEKKKFWKECNNLYEKQNDLKGQKYKIENCYDDKKCMA